MFKKCLALFLSVALLCLPLLGLAETIFTDDAGRAVSVPISVERFSPSGPLSQIMLFAIAPERFTNLASAWTSAAAPYMGDSMNLNVLGNLYGSSTLNLEELAAADPQVIIDIGEPKSGIAEDMDALQTQLGIPTVHISADFRTFADAYRKLGVLLDAAESAEILALYCEEILARTDAIMEQVGENRISILYCLGDDGLSVLANGSYPAELIDMISENKAVVDNPVNKGTGNTVDMEQLLVWDPEVIIFAPDSVYATVSNDPLWQDLRAISSGNYIETPLGPLNWMGFPSSVQRYLGLIWLSNTLYPDQCDYDLYTEIARYYDLFYHHELTQEQFDALMVHSYLPI